MDTDYKMGKDAAVRESYCAAPKHFQNEMFSSSTKGQIFKRDTTWPYEEVGHLVRTTICSTVSPENCAHLGGGPWGANQKTPQL